MSTRLVSILLGGALPAVFLGFMGIFQKLSASGGVSISGYLILFGLATVISGIIANFIFPGSFGSFRPLAYAFITGVGFSIATSLINFVLIRYRAPISLLSPVINTNALITVLVGLLVLKEIQNVEVSRLLIGSALILIGVIFVSNA